LLDKAGKIHPPTSEPLSARTFLAEAVDRWRLLRPEMHLEVEIRDCDPPASMPVEPTLTQALLNLLNNAADASRATGSEQVRLCARCNDRTLHIDIFDEGPGPLTAHRPQAGQLRVTTKPGGLGLGLVLSEATLSRLGGEVALHKREHGGTRTQITLPLTPIHA
jgi:two-component system sensor histidine kinase RegB